MSPSRTQGWTTRKSRHDELMFNVISGIPSKSAWKKRNVSLNKWSWNRVIKVLAFKKKTTTTTTKIA